MLRLKKIKNPYTSLLGWTGESFDGAHELPFRHLTPFSDYEAISVEFSLCDASCEP